MNSAKDVFKMDKVLKGVITVIIFFFFIMLWAFVFKATEGFTTVSSEWTCLGAITLILSFPALIVSLIFLHIRD